MKRLCSLFPSLVLDDGILCVGWLWWHLCFQFGKRKYKDVSLGISRNGIILNTNETDSFLHKSEDDDDRFFNKLSQDKDV